MKLKINFALSGKKQLLPLNYQYPMSSWIYKVLNNADEEFSRFLHDFGYNLDNGKTFKLFTFSKLGFPQHTWKIIPKSDRMQVWARKGWLTVSFHLPEQIEKFVMGLFQLQKVFIGDNLSGIEMNVGSIEAIKSVDFEDCVDKKFNICKKIEFKSITAIVLGLNEESMKNEQYIHPVHPKYKELFLKNLLDKYRATGKTHFSISDLDFKVKKFYTKTAMQRIKAGTPSETKVKAYYFDFELSAPKEIIDVGLNAGFGSMNSLGFGFCEIMKNN
jgi:CRISPR-associated endoribonuclease Cas6